MKNTSISVTAKTLVAIFFFALTAFAPAGPAYTWKSQNHDFGKIKKDQPVSTTFTFRNSGDAPLLITDAKAACGCTVAEFTRGSIPVGELGSVKVTFNAAKEGAFSKTVQVTSNVTGAPSIIQINGIVEE